jgi:signal transduction histidine kinase
MVSGIIRNLISNGIKFTKEGGSITVSNTYDNTNNFIVVCISDTGIGMSKELIEKLFRIDVKITSQGTANEKGTGLGLIICKEFAEMNGGKIWVESQPGLGSKFYFSLPVKKINSN